MKRNIACVMAVLLMMCSVAGCHVKGSEETATTVTTVATASAVTTDGAASTTAESTQLEITGAQTEGTEAVASSSAEISGETQKETGVQTSGSTVGTTTVFTSKKTAGTSSIEKTTRTAKTSQTTKTKKTKSTEKTTVTTTTTSKTTGNAVTVLQPEDGLVIESQAPLIEYYLALDNDKDAALFWNATYYGIAHSASFKAQWRSNGRLWRVYVSTDPDFRNAKEILTLKNSLTVANLLPGNTYYWKVVTAAGEESEVRHVTVEPTAVRWIEADGGDNMRDLGGWKTESGKQVRYEQLYRGAAIDGYNGGPKLTADGIDIFNRQLGVRTEIDLRGSDAASASSPFGGTYVKATITQYDYIFDDKQSKESLGTIFELLSKESTYPVYFHCNAGADRTGTLAFLINGLLGVSYEDLTRDFELTGFAERGNRLRSAIDSQTGLFKSNGIMQNGDGNYVAWGPLYNTMMNNYGTGSGKLSDAIAAFLKTECGVTQEQIEAVCRILLTDSGK